MSNWTQRVLVGAAGATFAMSGLFAGSAVAAPVPGPVADAADDLLADENSPVVQSNQCDAVYSLTFLLNKYGLNVLGEPTSDIAGSACG